MAQRGRKKAAAGTLAQHEPKTRRCLGGCDREFFSRGPGDRICSRCRGRQGSASGAEINLVRVRWLQ